MCIRGPGAQMSAVGPVTDPKGAKEGRSHFELVENFSCEAQGQEIRREAPWGCTSHVCIKDTGGGGDSMEASSEQRHAHAKEGLQKEAGCGYKGPPQRRSQGTQAGEMARAKVHMCGSTGTFL